MEKTKTNIFKKTFSHIADKHYTCQPNM